MPETHKIVTKVWIAPGCIVCDACENDCPEVFDVTETTCLIRPPAMAQDFLKPLTHSIEVAAEGCPVDVIKYETLEVEGPDPYVVEPSKEAATAGGGGTLVAAKAVVPMAAPDPRWQAMLTHSTISQSKSATAPTSKIVKQAPEVTAAQEMIAAVKLPRSAPADMRAAMLAAGGAYQPATPLAQVVRQVGAKGNVTRRKFNVALTVAWGALAFCGATFGAMFQDFFGPKTLKEPKKIYRVGRLDDFGNVNTVYEQYKPQGIWMVNLQPNESKLIALSTICTHLGCIPNWLQGDQKFKCPCHGSGYYITGVNFEGPTPRPLERFAVSKDPDGFIVVDKGKTYRSELGEWDNPESFVSLV